MQNLFTYGSLMCSDIMFHVAGCKAEFSQAVLDGFFRSRIRRKNYPGMSPRADGQVPGIVYFALPTGAISRLDSFEGEMYLRQEVVVSTESHGLVQAMTYVIKPEYRDILTGEAWSFNDFLAHEKEKFMADYFGFREI